MTNLNEEVKRAREKLEKANEKLKGGFQTLACKSCDELRTKLRSSEAALEAAQEYIAAMERFQEATSAHTHTQPTAPDQPTQPTEPTRESRAERRALLIATLRGRALARAVNEAFLGEDNRPAVDLLDEAASLLEQNVSLALPPEVFPATSCGSVVSIGFGDGRLHNNGGNGSCGEIQCWVDVLTDRRDKDGLPIRIRLSSDNKQRFMVGMRVEVRVVKR